MVLSMYKRCRSKRLEKEAILVWRKYPGNERKFTVIILLNVPYYTTFRFQMQATAFLRLDFRRFMNDCL